MPWNPEDFDALEQDREAAGRYGVQYLPLIAGKPPIGVDLSGVTNVMLAGTLQNPLLDKVLAIPEGPPAEPAAPAEPVLPTQGLWEAAQKALAWQDAVLAAFVVDPPYCSLDQLPRGGRPPGQLCVWDFTPEERRAAVELVFQPADRLAAFRGDGSGALAGADGGDVAPAAESVGTADGAAVAPVVAGRGAVPAAPPPRGRGRHGAANGTSGAAPGPTG